MRLARPGRALRAVALAALAAPLAALAALAPACSDGGGGGDPEAGGWTPTLADAYDTGWLLSVGGRSGDALLAAGGEPDAGRLFAFDGAAWAPVTLPVAPPLLNWVHAFPDGRVMVAGDQGTVLLRDDAGWRVLPTPTDQNLWGVWGASFDDAWAVGGNGRDEGQATVLRWDGAAWTEAAVPPLQRPTVYAFFKVWGTSATDVTVVGQRGAILHWDGQALEERAGPTTDDLISLWGTSPDRIVAVGGRNNGVVARWDGASWEARNLAPVPGLNGVWMRDPAVAHVVGARGTRLVVDVDALAVREDDSLETELDFHAVFGDPAGVLTAVGGSLFFPNPPHLGLAARRPLRAGE